MTVQHRTIVLLAKAWRILPVLASVLIYGGAQATVSQPFDGDWRGEIAKQNQSAKVPFRIVVRGETFTQYFCSSGVWKVVEKRKKKWLGRLRNQAAVVWIHQGGVWTETHMYSLSLVNEDTLELTWVRHVNNMKKDRNNTTWHLFRQGMLHRSTGIAKEC
ncbi:MAG: hypothetical protein OXC28_18700 [Defluviicoccus sp.]|nr:hypothetical protein [Defluviicoccus sp.]